MQHLRPIEETSYLSVPNAPQYRKIMRIFFREYEKMHFQLYKEDVLELLHQEDEFADYSMEQLKCHPSHYKLPHPSNCLGLNVGSDTIPVKFMVPFPSHFGNRRRSQTHVGVNDSSHGI